MRRVLHGFFCAMLVARGGLLDGAESSSGASSGSASGGQPPPSSLDSNSTLSALAATKRICRAGDAQFGASVAIGERELAVGAMFEFPAGGAAYIY